MERARTQWIIHAERVLDSNRHMRLSMVDVELPGGYVDHAEDVAAAAAREVEEETGWRPRSMEHLATFEPAIGSVDQPQLVYLARGADRTATVPDVNEAERVAWFFSRCRSRRR